MERYTDAISAAPPALSFEVEAAVEAAGRAYVIARLLEGGADFTLLDGTRLGGCPVEPWLDVPRALVSRGQQRVDCFAFCLRNAADKARFTPGARVLLTPPAPLAPTHAEASALEPLRRRALASVQRALGGDLTPEMQAVAVQVSATHINVVLYVDAGTPVEILEGFDAGAITQVVADFCWPERGDPIVTFESVELASGAPVPHRDGHDLVFARAQPASEER